MKSLSRLRTNLVRILVIDDEYEVRVALRKILELAGYEVAEAENGKVGVAVYRERPADVVIMDLFMPEQEGLRTIVLLRRDYPDVKVIVISGGGRLGRTDLLSVLKNFGILHTFEKPFEAQEILDAVKQLVDK